jgi:putative ABC transport system permease protein
LTDAVSRIFKKFFPVKLMDLDWVDGMLNTQYVAEQKLQQLFEFFSLLSMILASLGIFGLIVHASSVRVKEIGVRKVLGAGVGSVVRLLTSDFVRLVCIAFLIASPIGWWLMSKWLKDYAYRMPVSWWMFALAGGLTLLIATVTVSFQAIKAAMANPVESLRAE